MLRNEASNFYNEYYRLYLKVLFLAHSLLSKGIFVQVINEAVEHQSVINRFFFKIPSIIYY